MAAALGIWLCAVAGPDALAKGGKGKKPGAATGNAAIEAIFESAQPAIRECALKHGIYKGAKRIVLNATIMVARDGRVFSEQVKAETDGGNSKDLEACVGKVLHVLAFPSASDTFRKVLRNWQFATQ